MQKRQSIDRLLSIMATLRDPDGGCPWDLEQSIETLTPYTIEEAYEVADAAHSGDRNALKDELGDLLLQVVFYSQIASENCDFTFEDVAQTVSDKMVRRHPHVFGDGQADTANDVMVNWENIKDKERSVGKENNVSAMDGVAKALPALLRAQKLQNRASRTGFEFSSLKELFDKIDEELSELKDAIACEDKPHIKEELGDVLFITSKLGKWLETDSETALRAANDKFESRFRKMEAQLNETASVEDMKRIWNELRAAEKEN